MDNSKSGKSENLEVEYGEKTNHQQPNPTSQYKSKEELEKIVFKHTGSKSRDEPPATLIYKVSKEDFKDFVQKHTGQKSRDLPVELSIIHPNHKTCNILCFNQIRKRSYLMIVKVTIES